MVLSMSSGALFDPALDLILMLVFAVLGLVFALGKGEGVLKAFGSKNAPLVKKKHSPEYRRKYQMVIAIFLFILAATELVLYLFTDANTIVDIIMMVIVVADLIGVMIVLRKKFPEGF